MRSAVLGAMILLGSLGANSSADASQNRATPGQNRADTRMAEFSATKPPIGYVQFCRQYPSECNHGRSLAQRPVLTQERMNELLDVNARVNRAIAPVTDKALYGVEERWTYPLDRGDCEDYVLLKQRMLIDRGWPPSALLITVVRDTNGDGHAVLTVATSAGDLVLDNQEGTIRFWRDTPYDYLKRQSTTNPNAWVSLRNERIKSWSTVGGTSTR